MMKNKGKRKGIWSHLLIYLLINFLSFGLSNLVVNNHFWMDGKAYPSLLIASLIASLISYFLSRQNLINATSQVPQLVWKNIEYFFLFIFFVLSYWFLVSSRHYFKEQIILFFVFYSILLLFVNVLYIRYLRKVRFDIPYTKTLVIGENTFTNQFVDSINTNNWLGFDFCKLLKPKYFSVLELERYILENEVGAVFINWDEFSLNSNKSKLLRNLAEQYNVKFFVISEVFGSKLIPNTYYLAGNFPYLNLYQYPLDSAFNVMSKRLFDVFFTLLFFVFIASWLFPIIIFINLLDSGFPVFFSQKRHGIDNKEFDCLKFRSMVQNKDCNDKITVKNDPRITKVGSILRKTSLDELPQFWNVLKGDMSIVGPRPHMVNQNYHYNQIISKYNFRHYVKPGITGLAQVNGFRGEIKEDKDMEDRIQSDLYYIRNWSFGLDISIIYRTVVDMVRGDENAI